MDPQRGGEVTFAAVTHQLSTSITAEGGGAAAYRVESVRFAPKGTKAAVDPVANHVPGRFNDDPAPLPGAGGGGGGRGLIVLAHGWKSSPDAWATGLAAQLRGEIEASGTAKDWTVWAYDWSEDAATKLPGTAANRAESIGGVLGTRAVESGRFDAYHFVGHSAGSWLVEGALREIERQDPAAQTQNHFSGFFRFGAAAALRAGGGGRRLRAVCGRSGVLEHAGLRRGARA